MSSKYDFVKLCKTICSLILICAATSCKNYSVSVNNNVVYTPPPLFKDFTFSDVHLRDCVQQTIIDNHITKADDLKQLNCSNAGIKSIVGLEKFYAIEQLNLAQNNLESITQLSNLAQLKTLILRKNNLTNAEPLLHLLHLKELDIAENPHLACADIKQVMANFRPGDLKVTLPEQCN